MARLSPSPSREDSTPPVLSPRLSFLSCRRLVQIPFAPALSIRFDVFRYNNCCLRDSIYNDVLISYSTFAGSLPGVRTLGTGATDWASRVQDNTTDPSLQRYRIGTVASMTGIAVERLRAWERRYGLAPTARAGRARVYDGHQVTQLRLIHTLIERGHPISTLVGLTTAQLSERLSGVTAAEPASAAEPARASAPPSPSAAVAAAHVKSRQTLRQLEQPQLRQPRIGLAGLNLLVLEQSAGPDNRLAVMARWANLDTLLSQREADCPVDVLIIQQPVLLAHRLDAVLAIWPHVRVIALYQFAAPRQREAVAGRDIPALSWPCDWRTIEDTALGLSAEVEALPAARQFDDAQLVALAASDTDPNQCVRHLVDLISSLNAFAEYTAHCVESVSAPVGAVYSRMQMDSAHARALLESALALATGSEEDFANPAQGSRD